MRVEEVLLLVDHAPAGDDGTATAHDACRAFECKRNVLEQKSCVDRKVVDALFGLFNKRIAEHFPREVVSDAVHLFECLVHRHRSYRYWAVAQNPFARFVDVLAGREVHHRICTPAHGPDHLFDFLFNRRSDRRVSDVGVDFREEVTSDNHRFAFRVVHVGRDDGAAFGEFLAHEFRRDGITVAAKNFVHLLVFADGDVFHFARDDAFAGVLHLSLVGAVFFQAFADPRFTEAFKSFLYINRLVGVAISATRIVNREHGAFRVVERNFAHGDFQIRKNLTGDINLARLWKRLEKAVGFRHIRSFCSITNQVQGV